MATQLDEKSIRDLVTGFFSISNAVATFDPADKPHATEILFNSIVDDPTTEANRKIFEERIARILKTKSIEITGKALSVMLDNPNTFHSTRIVSEIRPVFTDDGLEPRAAVIVHQLKISFVTGVDRHFNEAFFALDRDDLGRLKAVVERALDKHAKLAQQVQQLNLPLLEEPYGG
ncbi:MAG TPA: hypothetical protein VH165_02395 [Kofleriaceae bacterium]|nr:hypothetical protein [Kofleriaceae bacterium]